MSLVWTDANQFAAANDGWHLKNTSSTWRLVPIGSRFAGNSRKLFAHIIERAAHGSPLHLKLLAIIYVQNKKAFLSIMNTVPANKTGAVVKTVHAMARVAGAITGGQ